MKQLLLLPLLAGTSLFAQNGLTVHAFPTSSAHYCITSDNTGKIYVGTGNSGIKMFDGSNWTTYDNSNTPMLYNHIQSLAVQSNNVLWTGISVTASSGELFEFNGSTWTDHTADIGSHFPKAIVADNASNTIWVGTIGNGLYKYNGSAWSNYTVANSGLASDTVLSLAIDPSGNLLAGTIRGLSVQNGASWTNFNSSNTPSFVNQNVTNIYSDAANGTWIMLDKEPGKFSGNTFVPVSTLFPSAVANYPTQNTFARGVNGGVVFGYSGTTLVEFTGNTPHFYTYPGIAGNYFTYNAASSKLWLTGFIGSSPLCEFDGVGYYGISNTAIPANARTLDVNQVNTAILNRGDMNWNLQQAYYEVPKGGGAHTVFSSALWIGGLDGGGNLHQAAMTYRQTGMDFFPGPLDTISGSTDSLTASQFDYIWKINRTEILAFQYYWSIGAVQNGSYVPGYDFLSWPAQGTGNYTRRMAPFVDVNSNGVYDPLTGGDYPDIKGDQMLYWVFNDNLAAHTETGGQPLKVEVHASAYAFSCGSVADSNTVLNYTTYYHFEVYNRSGQTYHQSYLGCFQDCDLGAYDDDFVGAYPQGNFVFAYNGDVNDGTSALPTVGTYGAHPPTSALAILHGPVAQPGDGIDNDNDGTIDEAGEENLLSAFVSYGNDFSPRGNPEAADDFYNYMTAHWKDSLPVTFGGNGYGGNTPVNFMFPGLPYDTASWTEPVAGNTPNDRRFVASCGPFDLTPSAPAVLDYAIVYTRDTMLAQNDPATYFEMRDNVNKVRNWYLNNSEPSCVTWGVGISEPAAIMQFSLYPNPASTMFTIEYQPQHANASYEIIDLTGRALVKAQLSENGFSYIPVEELSSGVYFVRIIDGENSAAKKIVRQ